MNEKCCVGNVRKNCFIYIILLSPQWGGLLSLCFLVEGKNWRSGWWTRVVESRWIARFSGTGPISWGSFPPIWLDDTYRSVFRRWSCILRPCANFVSCFPGNPDVAPPAFKLIPGYWEWICGGRKTGLRPTVGVMPTSSLVRRILNQWWWEWGAF